MILKINTKNMDEQKLFFEWVLKSKEKIMNEKECMNDFRNM